jgi:psp operon transcriptional activator
MTQGSPQHITPSVGTDARGQSEAFLLFQEKLSRVAAVNRPVLLIGERGTGKELASTRLHYLSQRWQEPFMALNSAALSSALIETELFGHEQGAFTGAHQKRKGRFEAANNGTLFLDEIGAIPMEVQEKILRVVEYGSFERVGGATTVEVDVRLIGATNVDLLDLTNKGRFKRDLLDRLSFEVLFLPPLRDRTGDITLLAGHFARRMAFELGWEDIPIFSDQAIERLNSYQWPGNVRELKNVVERAVYRSHSQVIHDIDFNPFKSPYALQPEELERQLPRDITGEEPLDFTKMPLKKALKSLERHMVQTALISTQYNQTKAAALLGLTYDQFRGVYRKYRGDI